MLQRQGRIPYFGNLSVLQMMLRRHSAEHTNQNPVLLSDSVRTNVVTSRAYVGLPMYMYASACGLCATMGCSMFNK